MPIDEGPQSNGRTADIVATIALLIVHGFLWAATGALLGLLVMVTDPCDYQRCGDPAWIDRAMWVGLGAGVAVGIVDLVFAIRRLVQRKTAFFVPLIGCAAQLALGAGAAGLEMLAGPVS